jgi:hypothetical protein
MHGGGEAKRHCYMAMITGISALLSDSKSTINQTITDFMIQYLPRTAASNRVTEGISCFWVHYRAHKSSLCYQILHEHLLVINLVKNSQFWLHYRVHNKNAIL